MITKFKLYEINAEDTTKGIFGQNYNKLYAAVLTGDFEIIKNYINNGGDIDHRFDDQETLLSSALKNGYTEIANYLIENGADINQVDHKKNTLLIQLCSSSIYSKSEVMVQLLVDAGAELNHKDNRGYTALMCAAIVHEMELVKILIDSDWNNTTMSGHTFLQMLHKKEITEITELYPEKYDDYIHHKNMEKYKI